MSGFGNLCLRHGIESLAMIPTIIGNDSISSPKEEALNIDE